MFAVSFRPRPHFTKVFLLGGGGGGEGGRLFCISKNSMKQ